MNNYVWLFPILFIIHDMEEIIGFGIWLKKNRLMLMEKYPKISRTYANYSTEGMAVAVLEELLVCTLLCLFTIILRNKILQLLWLGGFIAYTLHLVIHIIQSVVIKQYIPALITSIIALPISVWIIYECISIMNYGIHSIIIYSILGIFIVALNLKFAQTLIGKFTLWITKI